MGGSRPRCCGGPIPQGAGFTLIEILVVVVIVAVLALAVTISIATAGGERQLSRESERLQALIAHACTEAELSGREIGVRISRNGYAFTLLGFEGWMASGQKDELRPRTWVPGLQVALYRDGSEMRLVEDESQSPQIVCFSSGELSPFVLRLALGDAAKHYEVRGKADGRIDVEAVDMRP
ncbi:MAG: type II secretion system minor pseudopilin GspH [Xanthomonadales bacterium]|nr:type II secretion system minor pseudopilin GspH [Xanthomonadales bacterium]